MPRPGTRRGIYYVQARIKKYPGFSRGRVAKRYGDEILLPDLPDGAIYRLAGLSSG